MSQTNSQEERDFSSFDAMTTQQLEEILRQDALLDDDKSDIDAVLYISKLLSDRELAQRPDRYPTAEELLGTFHTDYLPAANSIRAYYSQSDEPAAGAARRKKRILRIVVIAAVVAVMAAALMGVAYGTGLKGLVASWNIKDFWVSEQADMDLKEDVVLLTSEEYLSFMNTMESYGLPSDIVPSYVPDGYMFVGHDSIESSFYTILSAYFVNDAGHEIRYDYTIYSSYSTLYPKDDDSPEVYTVDGIEYGIVANEGDYKAIWQWENVECIISGFESRDELIKSIDSMY